MKRKEIFLVAVVMVFGFVYYSIHNIDIGFARGKFFSFESSRLVTDSYHEFLESKAFFSNIHSIDIQNLAGTIVAERSIAGQTEVKIIGRVFHQEKIKAERIWRSISVAKETSGGKLHFYVSSSKRFPLNRVRVFFYLKIPESVDISIENSLGEINLLGAGRRIEIKQDFGDIFVKNISSYLKIEANHGAVHLNDVQGKAIVKTQYCDFFADNINDLEFAGRRGAIAIKNISERAFLFQAFGRIVVDSAKNVEINASNSQLHVRNIQGSLNIRNSNGKVAMEWIQGNVFLDTKSCTVDLKDSSVDTLTSQNSGDELKWVNISGSVVRLVSRDCTAFLQFENVSESVSIDSSYSDITVELPPSLKPDLIIDNEFGKITNSTSLDLAFTGQQVKTKMRTSAMNPTIFIHSFYGSVLLKNRQS